MPSKGARITVRSISTSIYAVEGRADHGTFDIDLDTAQLRLRGLEIGLRLGQSGLGLVALGGQFAGCCILDLALLHHGSCLVQQSLAFIHSKLDDDVVLFNHGTFLRLHGDNARGRFRLEGGVARRFRLSGQHQRNCPNFGDRVAHLYSHRRLCCWCRGFRGQVGALVVARRGITNICRGQPSGGHECYDQRYQV
jgi:hypothetical protein